MPRRPSFVLSHFDIQQSEMIDFIMEKVNRRQQPDILHGSLWKALQQFAIPVATTAILEQLFNASDLAVVGNFSQQDSTVAVAAVGANSPLIGLIVNLFIGIALGSNVVIAHAVGQGKKEAVEKAVHTSVIVALLGELVAAPVLRLLQRCFPMRSAQRFCFSAFCTPNNPSACSCAVYALIPQPLGKFCASGSQQGWELFMSSKKNKKIKYNLSCRADSSHMRTS